MRSHPGTVAAVGADALAAGGKRLRPMLVFLIAARWARAARRGSRRRGSSTWRRSSTTTSSTARVTAAAAPRRGPYGEPAARAAGDYLFARAFAEIGETRDAEAVELLADATLCLARGEALQRAMTRDPDTTVERYLRGAPSRPERSSRRRACSSAAAEPWLGEFGTALGTAFQITDDILDCTGEATEDGQDRRRRSPRGTPTLPLLLAAGRIRSSTTPWRAGPLDGALVRVAATGGSSASGRSRSTTLTARGRASTAMPIARSSKP